MAEHGRWPLPILRQTLSSQRKKLSPPIPWKQGGGFLGSLALPQSWPCHSPGLLAGFTTLLLPPQWQTEAALFLLP